MAKAKSSTTGLGYVGETMIHRASGASGVVEAVVEARDGWPPQVTLKLPNGSVKKGKLSDFRELRGAKPKSPDA
jgi:hypothetical protein